MNMWNLHVICLCPVYNMIVFRVSYEYFQNVSCSKQCKKTLPVCYHLFYKHFNCDFPLIGQVKLYFSVLCSLYSEVRAFVSSCHHHHHQVPDLEQTLATMPLQTSLSLDNFKKFKPLLCPPVAELQRLSRNVIRCLPLSRLPSTLPVKDKNSKPLRLHTCPKNSICLFLIVFNSDL